MLYVAWSDGGLGLPNPFEADVSTQKPVRQRSERISIARTTCAEQIRCLVEGGKIRKEMQHMAEVRVSAEHVIPAPPEQVYSYIADFQRHHPHFLPPAFSSFHVEEGGVGAGTVVSYRLKAGGRNRAYRARIGEPEPGRVLTETLSDANTLTTFTVEPDSGGSRVRIETRWDSARGFEGWMERTFAPRVLRRLYADELTRLDAYAGAQGRAG